MCLKRTTPSSYLMICLWIFNSIRIKTSNLKPQISNLIRTFAAMNHITRIDRWLVGISSVLHFLVDGLCVCCLYLTAWPFTVPNLVAIFVTYNVLAFLTQPLTGHIADRLHHRHWMQVTSVALLALAVAWAGVVVMVPSLHTSWGAMMVVASLLGIGNSLFHVWGGKQTVITTGNDIRALGVFVATGAFGLAIGVLFYSWWLLLLMLLLICVLTVAYFVLDGSPISHSTFHYLRSTRHHRLSTHHLPPTTLLLVSLAMLALMSFVAFRSYVGQVFPAGMAKTGEIVLAVGAVSMLGKMAGGWLAKWIGIVWSLVVAVVITALCLLLQGQGTPVLFLGLFAINCTMPVTLYLANIVLPGREGLAFGLLAAALMPGYLLS